MGLHVAAVRRLTGNEHLSHDFATTWATYDLDPKTKSLLAYASKLTESPSMVDEGDTNKLRKSGWNEKEVWEISALVSFFNFSGRMESASGLPQDQIPQGAKFAEAASG